MIMSMESVNGQTGAEPRTGDRRHRHFASVLRAIAGVLDLEAVLAEITAAVTAVRPDGVCLVRLVDREAGGYRLARAPGILAGRPRIIPFGTGLNEVVARSRQPLLIPDVRSDPRFVDVAWYVGRDLTVFYGVPLLDGEEVLGILNVSLPTGAQPTEEEREDIDLFAAQAALAIKNARLFGEAERRRREAEALAAVARGWRRASMRPRSARASSMGCSRFSVVRFPVCGAVCRTARSSRWPGAAASLRGAKRTPFHRERAWWARPRSRASRSGCPTC